MKVVRSLALLLFAALAFPANAAVTAELAIDPAVALPGQPVTAIVTIHNADGEHAVVPLRLAVRARTADAAEFGVGGTSGELSTPLDSEYRELLTIPAGTESKVRIPLGQTLCGGWFADRRLWDAGEYRLSLTFVDAKGDAFLTTPFAPLRVRGGTDADERIWRTILERTHGYGLGVVPADEQIAIASELRPAAAGSGYAFFLGMLAPGSTAEEKIATFKRLQETAPSIDFERRLRLVVAVMEGREARRLAKRSHDFAAAKKLNDAAAEALRALLREPVKDVYRVRASDELSRITTDDALRALLRSEP